jgi:predicted DNA-binding transcriptional regulator YafY
MDESSATTRVRRLLALLPFLNEQRAFPLSELAGAVGTDERTVADDLTTLSLCGSDERDPGQLIGVWVEDDVVQVFADLPALGRPVRLTPVEASALVAALQTVGVDPLGPLVCRLTEFASRSVDLDDVAATVRAAFAQGGQAAVIAALDVAAERGVAARIAYASPGSEQEAVRIVRPYALYRWRDVWYVLAHCESADEQRTFRVDRITSVEMTAQRFERPEGLAATAHPLPDLDTLPRAVVRFESDAADLTEREWPGAVFEMNLDGTVTASVPFAGTSWIARRVVARLGQAEVLSPPEVRAAVAETAQVMLSTSQS